MLFNHTQSSIQYMPCLWKRCYCVMVCYVQIIMTFGKAISQLWKKQDSEAGRIHGWFVFLIRWKTIKHNWMTKPTEMKLSNNQWISTKGTRIEDNVLTYVLVGLSLFAILEDFLLIDDQCCLLFFSVVYNLIYIWPRNLDIKWIMDINVILAIWK